MNPTQYKPLQCVKNPAKQSGMTLLEVLVATGILAVISSMAFLSLDTLIQSKQNLNDKTQSLNQFNLAQFQFQNDVQMAISSNQILPNSTVAEFEADSQSITLMRYRSAVVPNQRDQRTHSQQTRFKLNQQPLIRVRWYVRNDQWFRATQSAASPLNSNQWQIRPMLAIKSLNCNYQNTAGQVQSKWPNNQTDYTRLPQLVNCQIRLTNDENSVLKLVPWQQAEWL